MYRLSINISILLGPCMFVFYGAYLLVQKIMNRQKFAAVNREDVATVPDEE